VSDEDTEVQEKAETQTERQIEEEVQVAKTFTQEELDKIVADRVSREKRKHEKSLDGVNLEEAKELLKAKQDADLKRQQERGEFDAIMKSTVEKKDAVIANLESEVYTFKVDSALMSAATKHNAVSPDQVTALLKNKVRLSDDRVAEVMGEGTDTPRYNDKGELLTVDELVQEFLTANPHFVRASSGGAGSQGNAGGTTSKPQTVDDMLKTWTTGGKEAYGAMKKAKQAN